jgi:hypothetical protein
MILIRQNSGTGTTLPVLPTKNASITAGRIPFTEIFSGAVEAFAEQWLSLLLFMEESRKLFKVEFIQESGKLRQCAAEIHIVPDP